jgi:hypothetical protein
MMTKKKEWLFIKFSDGRTYRIPALLIAQHRAEYFARVESHQGLAKEILDDEIDFALTDTYELEDWATSNMDWLDVKDSAKLVMEKQIDYSMEWVDAEKWVE